MKQIVHILWPATLIALVIQSLVYYPELPQQMASHFDSAGHPNDYSSKINFIILWYFLIIFLNVWVPVTRLLIGKLPVQFINVPNKRYWLETPERRKALAQILFTAMGAIFIGVNLMMMFAFHYTLQANLGRPMMLNFGWVIIVFLGFVALALYLLVRKTRDIKKAP